MRLTTSGPARLALALCGALAMTAPVLAAEGTFSAMVPTRGDLNDMRWEKRPVLIFAASTANPEFVQQMSMLRQDPEGLADRDIVVLEDTSPSDNGVLRTALRPGAFTIILVGKDGGVKLRKDTPLAPSELFATIDRMPMRQREMRK